jgi:hypothetical protein
MYFFSALLAAVVVGLSITQGPLLIASIGGSLAVVAIVLVSMPKLRAAHRSRRIT